MPVSGSDRDVQRFEKTLATREEGLDKVDRSDPAWPNIPPAGRLIDVRERVDHEIIEHTDRLRKVNDYLERDLELESDSGALEVATEAGLQELQRHDNIMARLKDLQRDNFAKMISTLSKSDLGVAMMLESLDKTGHGSPVPRRGGLDSKTHGEIRSLFQKCQIRSELCAELDDKPVWNDKDLVKAIEAQFSTYESALEAARVPTSHNTSALGSSPPTAQSLPFRRSKDEKESSLVLGEPLSPIIEDEDMEDEHMEDVDEQGISSDSSEEIDPESQYQIRLQQEQSAREDTTLDDDSESETSTSADDVAAEDPASVEEMERLKQLLCHYDKKLIIATVYGLPSNDELLVQAVENEFEHSNRLRFVGQYQPSAHGCITYFNNAEYYKWEPRTGFDAFLVLAMILVLDSERKAGRDVKHDVLFPQLLWFHKKINAVSGPQNSVYSAGGNKLLLQYFTEALTSKPAQLTKALLNMAVGIMHVISDREAIFDLLITNATERHQSREYPWSHWSVLEKITLMWVYYIYEKTPEWLPEDYSEQAIRLRDHFEETQTSCELADIIQAARGFIDTTGGCEYEELRGPGGEILMFLRENFSEYIFIRRRGATYFTQGTINIKVHNEDSSRFYVRPSSFRDMPWFEFREKSTVFQYMVYNHGFTFDRALSACLDGRQNL